MMDSGSGGGAFTGQRAESPGLMLNALRFGLRVVTGFFLPEIESADTRETGRESLRGLSLRARALLESAFAVSAPLLLCSESAGTGPPAELSVSRVVGRLRGIRIAWGDQSLGCTSQSCSSSTVCCATAPAGPLPQPNTKTVRNAVVVVE